MRKRVALTAAGAVPTGSDDGIFLFDMHLEILGTLVITVSSSSFADGNRSIG